MIHGGDLRTWEVDLEREFREISTIIRAIYAAILKGSVVRDN
jgi:hypothetical protein